MSQMKKRRGLCVVDLCTNEGVHLFPRDESHRQQWAQAIGHFKPGRTLKKYTQICSAHFKPDDFIRTRLSLLQPDVALKVLKKTAIPSIFPWTKTSEPPVTPKDEDSANELQAPNFSQIQNTYVRIRPISFVEEQTDLNSIPSELSKDPLKCDTEEAELDEQPSSEVVSNTDMETEEFNASEYLEVLYKESSKENRQCHEKFVQTEDVTVITLKHGSTQTNDKGTQTINDFKDSDKAIYIICI